MKVIYKILCISILALLLDIPYLIYTKDTFMDMIYRVQGGQSFNFRFIYLIPIYILIGIVIYYYVFSGLKADKEYNTNELIIRAFLIGVCIYGIYNLTNYALLTNWDFNFIFQDTLWGGILFTLTSLIANKIFINFI
jgi:uncharacterized membrane protein